MSNSDDERLTVNLVSANLAMPAPGDAVNQDRVYCEGTLTSKTIVLAAEPVHLHLAAATFSLDIATATLLETSLAGC
jgi:hypothetical protein